MAGDFFKKASSLRKFILNDVEFSGRKLGVGSYGEVEEVYVAGSKYAGKTFHHVLFKPNDYIALQTIASECQLLSDLRHPNIVQFLGLYSSPMGSYRCPTLIMEYISESLHNFLASSANVSIALKSSILIDVLNGLIYLHGHNPPVVHGDLTARNVLLTSSMQAKISDLGNVRLVDPSAMSKQPGKALHLPPEATKSEFQYKPMLDMFSFGHMALHTVTQVFPKELTSQTCVDAKTQQLSVRSELQRRSFYISLMYDQIGEDHQLSKMIVLCLNNVPTLRPTASDALHWVEKVWSKLDLQGGDHCQNRKKTTQCQNEKGATQPHFVEKEKYRITRRDTMESHFKNGHPGVLDMCKTGKGLKRNHKVWRQYVFKIVNSTLHQYMLNDKLQGELQLSDISDVVAYNVSNTTMFPFHIYFNGRGSPWTLSAHSESERESWMEAIKSGSTLNQFANSRRENRPTVHQDEFCPYIPLDELHVPSVPPKPSREDMPAVNDPPYVQLLSASCGNQLTEQNRTHLKMYAKEFMKHFDPSQMDLIVKILQSAHSRSQACCQEKVKSGDTLKQADEPCSQPPPNDDDNGGDNLPLSEEEGPYHCLADLLIHGEEPCTSISDLLDDQGDIEQDKGKESTNTVPLSSRLQRQNAVRMPLNNAPWGATKKKCGEESDTPPPLPPKRRNPKETVTKLRRLVRRASSDDFLDGCTDQKHEWLKANATAPKADECDEHSVSTGEQYSIPDELSISRHSLEAQQQIGNGQFGPTYFARMVNTGVSVILKSNKLHAPRGKIDDALRQMLILKHLPNRSCAKVYGIIIEGNWLTIVQEYLPHGDLKNFLRSNRHSVNQLVKYVMDIAMGMHHITVTVGIVHGKLSARNILIGRDEQCKVADLSYGLHCDYIKPKRCHANPSHSGDVNQKSLLRWMAPESLLHGQYSPASDVWSYGVLLWEVFNLTKLPYELLDDRQVLEKVTNGCVLDIPSQCPDVFKRVMKKCWYQSPAMRPSFLFIATCLADFTLNMKAARN